MLRLRLVVIVMRNTSIGAIPPFDARRNEFETLSEAGENNTSQQRFSVDVHSLITLSKDMYHGARNDIRCKPSDAADVPAFAGRYPWPKARSPPTFWTPPADSQHCVHCTLRQLCNLEKLRRNTPKSVTVSRLRGQRVRSCSPWKTAWHPALRDTNKWYSDCGHITHTTVPFLPASLEQDLTIS